jgi:hypothetical protein
MRMILIAGAALAITACGGGGNKSGTNTANGTMGTNGATTNGMMTPPPAAGVGTNGAMGAPAAPNGAMDSNTQNLMAKDARTNDPDTNLANGF